MVSVRFKTRSKDYHLVPIWGPLETFWWHVAVEPLCCGQRVGHAGGALSVNTRTFYWIVNLIGSQRRVISWCHVGRPGYQPYFALLVKDSRLAEAGEKGNVASFLTRALLIKKCLWLYFHHNKTPFGWKQPINFIIYMILVVFAVQRTSVGHEELEDLSLERSVTNQIISTESCQIRGFVSNNRRATV